MSTGACGENRVAVAPPATAAQAAAAYATGDAQINGQLAGIGCYAARY